MRRSALPLRLLSPLLLTAAPLAAQATEAQLAQAEERIEAIYERGAFSVRPFRGAWEANGQEYTVPRQVEGQTVRVRIEAATGAERDPAPRAEAGPPGTPSPDGKHTLIQRGGSLFLRDLESGEEKQIGRTGEPRTLRNGNASWSPDGAWLAFVETDQSEVRLRSRLVPGDPSYPGVTEDRFARVGGKIAKLRVGIADAETGTVRWLDLQAPEEGIYLGMVEWAPDSNELLIEKLSRFRDERSFLLADAATGNIKRLFHEQDEAWVVASYGTNSGLSWLGGGKSFLVLSEQEGWRQAYVYSRTGDRILKLTPDQADIIERVRVDEASGYFYYAASPDNGTQKYLYRVPLEGNAPPERLTPTDQPGTHDYDIAPGGNWAFHTYSTFDQPPITELVSLPDHRRVRLLEERSGLQARAREVVHQPTEFLSLDLGEGVEVDAWLLKPKDFDPSKKYPLIVYVYGEPHAQTVLDGWGQAQAHYHRVLADQGYLVVSIDNRGTPAPKGAAWRRACFGSLGPLSTEEQAAAVQELARTRSNVDRSRVGIWGWSGGGSNTLNAMFRKPEIYQVGIAVAAKPQPWLYNAWFQEIYMETRETNPEGYQQSAPIHFAEGLQGDLLIVHGTGELNTHVQIIEGLVDRLIELGKRFDYMSYPNRRHGIREGAGTTVHLRMHMIRYWLDHLPAGPR